MILPQVCTKDIIWHNSRFINFVRSLHIVYQFDIFNKDLSCIAYIPKTLIDKELYTEYLLLGLDFLLGAKGITDSVLFQCVLPAFYFNLVKRDLTTNEEYTKLQNYQIGLH